MTRTALMKSLRKSSCREAPTARSSYTGFDIFARTRIALPSQNLSEKKTERGCVLPAEAVVVQRSDAMQQNEGDPRRVLFLPLRLAPSFSGACAGFSANNKMGSVRACFRVPRVQFAAFGEVARARAREREGDRAPRGPRRAFLLGSCADWLAGGRNPCFLVADAPRFFLSLNDLYSGGEAESPHERVTHN